MSIVEGIGSHWYITEHKGFNACGRNSPLPVFSTTCHRKLGQSERRQIAKVFLDRKVITSNGGSEAGEERGVPVGWLMMK
jgi:hypothetical protein